MVRGECVEDEYLYSSIEIYTSLFICHISCKNKKWVLTKEDTMVKFTLYQINAKNRNSKKLVFAQRVIGWCEMIKIAFELALEHCD